MAPRSDAGQTLVRWLVVCGLSIFSAAVWGSFDHQLHFFFYTLGCTQLHFFCRVKKHHQTTPIALNRVQTCLLSTKSVQNNFRTLVPTALFNCTFYLVRFLFISTSPSHDFGEVLTPFLKAFERYCHNKNADLGELNILSYFEAAYDMILIVDNPKPFMSWACMCAVWSALCCMLVEKKKHKVNLTP